MGLVTRRSISASRQIAAGVLRAGWIGAVLGAAAPVLLAQGTPSPATQRDTSTSRKLDTLKVVGRSDDLHGIASAASQGRIGAVDLRMRPLSREGELLETVPGMIVTQHSGEGKANQYFVRGFNLDHGTDFQTTVDGMPINMPSHAHGQGYTDLNFLIPELVSYLDYRLGVYYASVGDFGSAGADEFHLVRRLTTPFATVSAGQNGMQRVAGGASTLVGAGDLLVGGEVKGYDGPWHLEEKERKFSGLVRYSWDTGPSQFSVLAMGYHNKWRANDQIPLRAVTDGLTSRFGQIDSTDGGNTERYSLSGSWHHVGAHSVQDVQLYGVYSDLSLFSDFTYFLDNPVRGDQFNQREHRVVLGGKATNVQPVHALGLDHLLTFGLQTRADIVPSVGLYHTQDQVRFGTVRQDDVKEWGSGAFAELSSRWLPWFRSVVGLRGDMYTFDVTSDIPSNSGGTVSGIVSPKASLVFTMSPATELYLNGGFGFHSNDARAVTLTHDPTTGDAVRAAPALVRSRGAEIGARVTPVRGWLSTLALWALNLNSELTFSGDAGTNDPSAPSRRVGVTWANFYRPIPQLAIDADVSYAHARYADVPAGQTFIPGALENTLVAGITWTPEPHGVYGSLRVRRFGAYPLIQDNSVRARATTLFNADAGYVVSSGIRVQLTLLNLLNARGNDIDYYYPSRLPGEPAAGVNDQHFHPIEPRQLRVSLSWGI